MLVKIPRFSPPYYENHEVNCLTQDHANDQGDHLLRLIGYDGVVASGGRHVDHPEVAR